MVESNTLPNTKPNSEHKTYPIQRFREEKEKSTETREKSAQKKDKTKTINKTGITCSTQT